MARENKKGGVGIDKYYKYEIITNPVSKEFTDVLNKIASKYIFIAIYYWYGNNTIMVQRGRSDWYQSYETKENVRGAYFMCFIKDNKLLFQAIHKNLDETWRLEKCKMLVCSPVENPKLNVAPITWRTVTFTQEEKDKFKDAIDNLPKQNEQPNEQPNEQQNEQPNEQQNEQQNEQPNEQPNEEQNGKQGGKKNSLSRKPLDKCTVAELKEKAKKRGVKITGLKKDEILAKLRKK